MGTIDTTTVIYQLCEPFGERVGEPVIGPPGLDVDAYVEKYRADRYAAAEALKEDHCYVSSEGFVDWLMANGIVQPLPYQRCTVVVDTSHENAYVPQHWPQCPECHRGRGEEMSGAILHSLNRWTWYRRCTGCGHVWDEKDQPYDSKRPMLEDDGRYQDGGCVPYAISQVGGVAFETALKACRERGWTARDGMHDHDGLLAARALGLRVEAFSLRGIYGRPTLRRVLNILSPSRTYVIAIKGHWLAVIRGENRDQSATSPRAEVLNCWEVVP